MNGYGWVLGRRSKSQAGWLRDLTPESVPFSKMTSDYPPPDPMWLLAGDVSVVEAALLLLGIEPQGVSQYVENWSSVKQPIGYLAAREMIASAVHRKEVPGTIPTLAQQRSDERGGGFRMWADYSSAKVELMSLRKWLHERGYRATFLKLDDVVIEGFRDPGNPRYSAKLAAVVEAWESYDEDILPAGTVKQKLAKWLRMNAGRFGLTSDDGSPSESIIDDLAKVANWVMIGGAPTQTTVDSDPD